MQSRQISVIIPTLNESANIAKLICFLNTCPSDALLEILVVDGGSTDDTCEVAKSVGAQVFRCSKKGRAFQLNYGARKARGNILYFIHADVLPPSECFQEICKALDSGKKVGCFSYRFDSDSPMLKLNARFTRLGWLATTGGGDQTLYLEKETFLDLGGFREDFEIIEDFDFVKRARKKYGLHVIVKDVVVSARKYKNNSYLRVDKGREELIDSSVKLLSQPLCFYTL